MHVQISGYSDEDINSDTTPLLFGESTASIPGNI